MSSKGEYTFTDNVCVINEKQDAVKQNVNLDYTCEGFEGVSTLVIISTVANVYVESWNMDYIGFRLHGKANCNVKLEYQVDDMGKLCVTTAYSKDYFSGDLVLDAYVPYTMLEKVLVQLKYGNISVGKGVSTNEIYLCTRKGDISSLAVFKEGFFKTFFGQLIISVNAKTDVDLVVESFTGDIDLNLKNVSKIISDDQSKVKDFNNYSKLYNKGNALNLFVKTVKGCVTFR